MPDLEVDALGLLCPLPVLRLKKRMIPLPSGATILLLADDPAAHVDVPHFCAEAGHDFLGVDGTTFTIRKG
ncbi:MAG: sulfurtransferase TusA family protein [Pseudomonadota bacterium]